MLVSIIGMGLLIVQINVLINAWSKSFYDTLGAFDTPALYALMGRYIDLPRRLCADRRRPGLGAQSLGAALAPGHDRAVHPCLAR